MAWVTLSLRKMELVHQHNALEMEDLRISREERKMSRQYQLMQNEVQNEYDSQLRDEKVLYKNHKNELNEQLKTQDTDKDRANVQNQLDEAAQDYKEKYDEIKSECEDEVAMLEEEANDKESQYEDEKVQIETQMEAVAAEMDAIKQQISTDIQNEAIQLH